MFVTTLKYAIELHYLEHTFDKIVESHHEWLSVRMQKTKTHTHTQSESKIVGKWLSTLVRQAGQLQ